MGNRALALMVIVLLFGALASTPGRSASQAATPGASPVTSPVAPTPDLLATVQARGTATAAARATEAVVQATEESRAATATAELRATVAAAEATEVSRAATAAVGIAATATAAAVSGEQTAAALTARVAEVEGALVALATSEAEAVQAATTAQAQATAAQATADALSTEVANLEATANAEPTATRTPTPTSTPVPEQEAVLYEADTQDGLDAWPASGPWKHFNGMLINDGTCSGPSNLAPTYRPGEISDYAVEVEIQLVSPERNCLDYNNFGVKVRQVEQGWYGSGYGNVEGEAFIVRLTTDPNDQTEISEVHQLGSYGFSPDNNWHTYRAEVQGNTIRLLIDEVTVIETSDNRYLSGGRVELFCHGYQINVRSFRVIAL